MTCRNLPQESDAARAHARAGSRLAEAEETLEAIRRGEIDAVVVNDAAGEQRVYTLESADRPYRFLIEQMQEGAVTLAEDGTVLYCNRRLAQMLGLPQESVIGQDLRRFLADGEAPASPPCSADAGRTGARAEADVTLRRAATTFRSTLSLSPVQDRQHGCCAAS